MAIVAVVVRARADYAPPITEGECFRKHAESCFASRISVEYRGKLWPIERIFYKWFRCEIVHAGGLPVDIGFLDDAAPGELVVRAGGPPEYKLLVSPSWFHELLRWAAHDG